MYYYHLLVLWKEISSCAKGNLQGLMTEEWRSILGNTYWKSMWPRPNPGDVGSSNFDPAQFWIKGGPLFFGDKSSAKVASGLDMSSVLFCHFEVEIDVADDIEV